MTRQGKTALRGIQDGEVRYFDWTELFQVVEGGVWWRDNDALQSAIQTARQHVVSEAHRALTEVVFNKTYFSLEEAGQGYVTVSAQDIPEQPGRRGPCPAAGRSSSGFSQIVIRYRPSPYRDNRRRLLRGVEDMGTGQPAG